MPMPPLELFVAILARITLALAGWLAASMIGPWLAGTCARLGAYLGLDDGTRRGMPCALATVAAIAGLHRNAVAPPAGRAACEAGERHRLRNPSPR